MPLPISCLFRLLLANEQGLKQGRPASSAAALQAHPRQPANIDGGNVDETPKTFAGTCDNCQPDIERRRLVSVHHHTDGHLIEEAAAGVKGISLL